MASGNPGLEVHACMLPDQVRAPDTPQGPAQHQQGFLLHTEPGLTKGSPAPQKGEWTQNVGLKKSSKFLPLKLVTV